MTQRKYALELIVESGLGGTKPASTPLGTSSKLSSVEFDMQVLSQFMHKLKQSHMDAALRVVRYIKTAPSLGLLMPLKGLGRLEAYCDSGWSGYLQTRRFVTGYVVNFGDALISWKSKKQETIARSSAEAEFRSMASTQTAIQIEANSIFHEKTKHIDIDCHFVREKNMQGLIKTHHAPTKEQQADLLTKSIGKVHHDYLLSKLKLKDLFQPSA
ncbi:PREDICTED: uncharacterized protein LOC109237570 [Nicotiana attenuata]|uniref:uncharacterized protein LOC109237570 n=1 Tax=Nicotiana attenuata TaxID=49451 RepID=UPI0009052A79|nr:PREDICTED: uncharacterized protein LOC109237570 [Nicotiana attenuata]